MEELPSPLPPVFSGYPPWRGTPEAGCHTNFLGVMTSVSYSRSMDDSPQTGAPGYPSVDEELFEWIDVLESIEAAGRTFTMIELGAGYGRWLANAAAACRRSDTAYRLVGVEAEETHYRWMREHLERNGVDMECVSLLNVAVANEDGTVRFRVGGAFDCYGQRIVRSWRERVDWRRNWGGRSRRVPALSLASVLRRTNPEGVIDLIDLDVQSAEADVLEPAAALLDERVRRIHIGTHEPRSNEERLRTLFTRLGWDPVWDFPFARTVVTPFGTVAFQDGVQGWRNPRL